MVCVLIDFAAGTDTFVDNLGVPYPFPVTDLNLPNEMRFARLSGTRFSGFAAIRLGFVRHGRLFAPLLNLVQRGA